MADLEVALRPFQVYFDSNSSKLNRAALKAVRDAATALPKDATWRYELIGHADRSGPDARNMKLSRARAEPCGRRSQTRVLHAAAST